MEHHRAYETCNSDHLSFYYLSSTYYTVSEIVCIELSIHCFMGPAGVGIQCPLTSSLGEFPGYWDWLGTLAFRPCWCPSPFSSPSISRCFSIHSFTHLQLDFMRLLFSG